MSGVDDLIGGLLGGKGGGGLGGLLGGLQGDSGGSSTGGSGALLALLPVVTGLLANGGLGKVLSGFQASGLAAEADSWVGTGANDPVTGPQVADALGEEEIAAIAEKLGVPYEDAAAAVAEVLPAVVDRVTPAGAVPPDTELDDALAQLGAAAQAQG